MVIPFSLLPEPLGRLERAGVREKIGDLVVTNKVSKVVGWAANPMLYSTSNYTVDHSMISLRRAGWFATCALSKRCRLGLPAR